MKKIWVYGDSFAAPGEVDAKSWLDRLGRLLNLQVNNSAINGASTEYAIKNFVGAVHGNSIQDEDIVIFVNSSVGRMHFQYQNEQPHTAVWKNGDGYDLSDPKHHWFSNNKHYLEWYLSNIDLHVTSIAHEGFLHILKNFAETRNGPVIVLSNMSHNLDMPMGQIPKNFLRPKILLNEIAVSEVHNRASYSEWVKYTGNDLRMNHLSVPNLLILAKLVAQSITDLDTNCLTYDRFEKDIFKPVKNKAQYLEYVAQGLLYPNRPNDLNG
jgi:hypothetical protein